MNLGEDATLATVGGIGGCKKACLATEGCQAVCVTTITVTWEDNFKMCGLRRDVWPDHCSTDGHHDTYHIANPSPPPAAPRIPITRMSPGSRAALLNARFRDGHPSVKLAEAGLLVHQFDKLEMKGSPWKSCNTHCDNELAGRSLTGRISCMIMYGRMHNRKDRVAVPLVSNDGGIIARPGRGVNISCLFGIDGASVGLSGGPNGAGCPDNWCNPSGVREPNGYCGFWGAPPDHAWSPKNLDKLLELHAQHGVPYHAPGYHSGYNEAIVDGWNWNANMPNTIEAFFELEGRGVSQEGDGGRGQASYARDAHSRFLLEYGLTDYEVPLLKFDPSRWDKPFRAGSTDPVAILNDRFRMDPYGAWPADGSLSWSGVLVHCIDGYEDHKEPWKPMHPLMSASLIFAGQRVRGKGIPIFSEPATLERCVRRIPADRLCFRVVPRSLPRGGLDLSPGASDADRVRQRGRFGRWLQRAVLRAPAWARRLSALPKPWRWMWFFVEAGRFWHLLATGVGVAKVQLSFRMYALRTDQMDCPFSCLRVAEQPAFESLRLQTTRSLSRGQDPRATGLPTFPTQLKPSFSVKAPSLTPSAITTTIFFARMA